MVLTPQDPRVDVRRCGQCQRPCQAHAHSCSHCGEPICEHCLVAYMIQSRTHDGWIHHHHQCDAQSSAREFRS